MPKVTLSATEAQIIKLAAEKKAAAIQQLKAAALEVDRQFHADVQPVAVQYGIVDGTNVTFAQDGEVITAEWADPPKAKPQPKPKRKGGR